MEQVSRAYNPNYFKRCSDLLNNSLLRRYYRFIAVKYEPQFTKHGYSLTEGFGIDEEWLNDPEPMALPLELCIVTADAHALMVRLTTQSKGYIKRQLRARLPELLKVKIKYLFRKVARIKGQAGDGLLEEQKAAAFGQGLDDRLRKLIC
jgi:hypothetical protein